MKSTKYAKPAGNRKFHWWWTGGQQIRKHSIYCGVPYKPWELDIISYASYLDIVRINIIQPLSFNLLNKCKLTIPQQQLWVYLFYQNKYVNLSLV